jgi:hypothetical protein
MVAELLREGFALARRRVSLIFIDILWKVAWGIATAVMLVFVALWFGSQFQAIEWQAADVPGVNGLVAAALIRQLWNEYAAALGGAVVAVLLLSFLLWIVLEAFFRSRILSKVVRNDKCAVTDRAYSNDSLTVGAVYDRTFYPFKIYLLSNVARTTILAGAGSMLLLLTFGQFLTASFSEWPDLWYQTRSASLTSIIIFLCIAFFLTILDTLIRSDAVELFGTDLIRVGGVIGILVMFETLISAGAALAIITGFLMISSGAQAAVMLGVALAGIILMNAFHSYLLLVRFSAIGIMRHNVVEI